MKMQGNQVQLTDAELSVFAPFVERCDARKQGFAQGIEAAKQILLEQLLASRSGQEQKEG